MSKNLRVRYFIENARIEGKKVVMRHDNTYEYENLNKYDINKNILKVNDKKIAIKFVYESLDGCLMRIGEYVLEAI